jgi:hypothetical protein
MKVAVEKFEPVFLIPEGPARLTEYGKRWMDQRQSDMEKSQSILRDVVKLGEAQLAMWDEIQRILDDEGVPQGITSGVSQYGMSHLIDHINGKTSFTMPAAVAMALATTAPTSTTTGATLVEAAYTSYARQAILGAGFNAATSATPSVATNNGAVTSPNCTGGTSTLLGFMLTDSATLAAGNALWYGTLASVVISTTQTPPTVATTAMSLSMNGT